MIFTFFHVRFIGFLFVLMSLAYVIMGFTAPPKRVFPRFSLLEKASKIKDRNIGYGFAEFAVYPTTDHSIIPETIKLFGSWLDSDKSTGIIQSPWYQVDGSFYLMIAGYPGLIGNLLRVEVKNKDGILKFIQLGGIDPGDRSVMMKVIIEKKESQAKFEL